MITKALIEVVIEMSPAVIIMGIIVVGCVMFTKPEDDVKWEDIDGAK